MLLDAGAKVDCPDLSGFTPLHVAARDGCPESARVLIAFGADVDAANGYGGRPLHLAAQNDQRAVVMVLLEAGANPALTNKDGMTPLMEAHVSEWRREWLEKAIAENTPERQKARMIRQWHERRRRLAALRPKAPTL